MAAEKKSFILYTDLIHVVRKMPKDKAGELFLTILQYVNDENPVIEDMLLDLVFEPIKQKMKLDLKAWDETRNAKVISGHNGGVKSGEIRREKAQTKQNEANEASASKSKQSQANEPVTVTVIDTVTVNAIVSDTETVSEKKEKDADAISFVIKFNYLTQKNFKPSDKIKRQYNARIKEGYTEESILKAAENCLSDPYHVEHPNYLTPEFITRDDKLQKYSNYFKNVTNGQSTRKPAKGEYSAKEYRDAIHEVFRGPDSKPQP